ncbi:MAG: PAS domain S-box protein [Deltaproteobacteria bacterium]|nr:PAS domain S-box protein [Deltaproteobacteria bacterium]
MEREGSLSITAEGLVIRLGGSLEEILGYSADDIVGKEILMLASEDSRAELQTLINSVKVAESPVVAQKIELLQKSGASLEVYASIYPLRNRLGVLHSMMVTFNLKKNTSVPAILTEEFQRIFRFSNDAVAITDKVGSIIDVNQAFLDIYGYKREEVLGRNPRVLKSEHSTKELYTMMWKDILDPAKGYWRGEIINLKKDRTEVPVLLSINAIKDSKGEIKNFLGIAFDMTRQKELDKLNKMYIDYIIHDIRGPLTTIMVNSELLLMQLEGTLTEKNKRKFEAMINSTQRINKMTTDMIDYSRAQNNSLTIFKQKLSVGSVFKEAVAPFENMEKKLFVNGVIYNEYAMENRDIEADSDKLTRVFYNLLSNAFKYAVSEVRANLVFKESHLHFTITDDGKGITETEAQRVFDPFYQTEDGIKTGGAGLGLNIVKSFVEVHGGKIWVEAGQGGATFGFTIPLV